MIKIDVYYYGHHQSEHRCPSGKLTIGRHACDILLSHGRVSRTHAVLQWHGRRLMVTDQSTHGTRLNRTRLPPHTPTPVRVGDVLRIGPYRLPLVRELDASEVPKTQDDIELPLLVGDSRAMVAVREFVELVAPTPVNVLITGETGTGKGAAARAIYNARARGRFVALNMASISHDLFESELFGHEKGAFTGADTRRDGAIHAARRGTLFLDEVGELPPELQSKLLHVLEEREFRRVGSTTTEPVEARVIAATNRGLTHMMKKGTFRLDFFSRLDGMKLRMPALRERPEDIPALVDALLERLGLNPDITPEALRALAGMPWPDNVRGLRNTLQRAAVYARGQPIHTTHLEQEGPPPTGPEDIRRALEQCGSERRAAEQLGISRSTLKRRMESYGIAASKRGRKKKK